MSCFLQRTWFTDLLGHVYCLPWVLLTRNQYTEPLLPKPLLLSPPEIHEPQYAKGTCRERPWPRCTAPPALPLDGLEVWGSECSGHGGWGDTRIPQIHCSPSSPTMVCCKKQRCVPPRWRSSEQVRPHSHLLPFSASASLTVTSASGTRPFPKH